MALERTLSIIKPDAVGKNIIGKIYSRFEENGLQIGELRVTGGQARSPLWNQIKADITQRKILVPDVQDSELLGDACIGLYALGRHLLSHRRHGNRIAACSHHLRVAATIERGESQAYS